MSDTGFLTPEEWAMEKAKRDKIESEKAEMTERTYKREHPNKTIAALRAEHDKDSKPAAQAATHPIYARVSAQMAMLADKDATYAEEAEALIKRAVEGISKMGQIEYDDDVFPYMATIMLGDPRRVHSNKSVAVAIGVHPNTVGQWVDAHPRFALGVAQGLGIQEHNLSNLLLGGAKYSSGIEFILKNKHGWKDKSETSHVINIGSMIMDMNKNVRHVNWKDLEDHQGKGLIEAKKSDS